MMHILYIILSLVCVTAFGVTPAEFNKIRSLAEKGDSEAQCKLAEFYDWGDHVTLNEQEAVRWYMKAAEQGYARAQTNIADRYYLGNRGLPQDYKEAVKWYRKSAVQGSDWALVRLALCYQNGFGVPVNYIEAYAYLNVGSAIDKVFSGRRDSLAQEMTPTQIEAGQKRSMELQTEIDSRKASKEKKWWEFWR